MKKSEEQAADISAALHDLVNTPDQQKENEKRADTMQTRGVKGLKLERFNASFSPENMQYLKVMSALTGDTMTNFLNDIVTKSREEAGDLYKQAKKLAEKLKN